MKQLWKLPKVVNDSAINVVALTEEYNSIITRKENLQVVQDHRRKFPDCKVTAEKNCGISNQNSISRFLSLFALKYSFIEKNHFHFTNK